MTNEGGLAHDLLSPRRHVDKVYYARVAGRLTEAGCAALQFCRIARDIFFFRQKNYCVFGEDLAFFVGLSNLRNLSTSFSVKKRKAPGKVW